MKTLVNFLLKIKAQYNYHREVKQTINELSKLTNKELNDIGLSRGDIWHVAHDSHKQDKAPDVYANPNLRGFV